jgi:hypothetical protein
MRTRACLRPASLFAVAALCLLGLCMVGCGGGNGTYNPTLVGAATPRFTIAMNPPSASVVQGAAATYTITLTAVNGFAATVTPQATGLPAGSTAVFAPSSVTPTADGATTTLTVTTTASTPTGTSRFTVTATGSAGQPQASADLIVTAPIAPGSLQGSIQ